MDKQKDCYDPILGLLVVLIVAITLAVGIFIGELRVNVELRQMPEVHQVAPSCGD